MYMKSVKLLVKSVALAAVVVFVACEDEVKTEKEEIPTNPIEEMSYSPDATTFEVWAPTAESVVLRLYSGNELAEEHAMSKGECGLWSLKVEGDKKVRVCSKCGQKI